jgi:hypothetical protein
MLWVQITNKNNNKKMTIINKIILTLAFIITFITSVLGFNSNLVTVALSQINIYLAYFVKIWTILNFLVV